jgi:hypothetical protein
MIKTYDINSANIAEKCVGKLVAVSDISPEDAIISFNSNNIAVLQSIDYTHTTHPFVTANGRFRFIAGDEPYAENWYIIFEIDKISSMGPFSESVAIQEGEKLLKIHGKSVILAKGIHKIVPQITPKLETME